MKVRGSSDALTPNPDVAASFAYSPEVPRALMVTAQIRELPDGGLVLEERVMYANGAEGMAVRAEVRPPRPGLREEWLYADIERGGPEVRIVRRESAVFALTSRLFEIITLPRG